MTAGPTSRSDRPRTSTRDAAELAPVLAVWLREQLGASGTPELTVLGGPEGAGFSSETVLFDMDWEAAGGRRSGSYVLRLPPPPDAYPLFPHYDLVQQAAAMRFVRDRTSVPIPAVPWVGSDPAVLGAPFFVMERINGRAPPDMPLYVLGSWFSEASAEQQARAEAGVVRALAGIHGAATSRRQLQLLGLETAGDPPLRRHVEGQRAYYEWLREGQSFPVIEALFAWLEERWPEESPSVLSWGDARVGNVLFHNFEPVAILDWEAAAAGPRELDLGWLLFFHQYFQRFATMLEIEGMPHFLERGRVLESYAELTGHQPQHIDWYLVYAALRQALTSIRVSSRAVHFGERERPDDPSDLILDRQHLEDLVSGGAA
jgi:aminoglycoside phosphotransferase (APT) family kinase protein